MLLFFSVCIKGISCYARRCCCRDCCSKQISFSDTDDYVPGTNQSCCKDFFLSLRQIAKESAISISPVVYLFNILQQIAQFVISSYTVHNQALALNSISQCGNNWVWLSYQNIFVKVTDTGGTLIGIVGVFQLIVRIEMKRMGRLTTGGRTNECCCCCGCCPCCRGLVDPNETFCDRLYENLVIFAFVVSLIWFIPLFFTHILVGGLTYLILLVLVAVIIFLPAIFISRCCKVGIYGLPFKYATLFFLTSIIQASAHYAVLLYEKTAPISFHTYLGIISDEFFMRDTSCYFYGIYSSYSPTVVYELFLHLGI